MGRTDGARRGRLAAARRERKAGRDGTERRPGRLRRAAVLRLRSRVGFRRPRPPDARRPRHRDVLLRRPPDLFARRRPREPLPAARARRSALSAARTVRPRYVGGILPPPQLLPGRGAHHPDLPLPAVTRLLDLAAPMKGRWIFVLA